MNILTQAAKAAHLAKLAAKHNVTRYSLYPVGETEFWTQLFKFADNPRTAAKVLKEIEEIEHEPCIENERVFRSVMNVKAKARLTLLS